MAKNHPRYPIDVYRAEFTVILPTWDVRVRENLIIDIVRENPFGSAFEKRHFA